MRRAVRALTLWFSSAQRVFSASPKRDFCWIFTKAGVLRRLAFYCETSSKTRVLTVWTSTPIKSAGSALLLPHRATSPSKLEWIGQTFCRVSFFPKILSSTEASLCQIVASSVHPQACTHIRHILYYAHNWQNGFWTKIENLQFCICLMCPFNRPKMMTHLLLLECAWFARIFRSAHKS